MSIKYDIRSGMTSRLMTVGVMLLDSVIPALAESRRLPVPPYLLGFRVQGAGCRVQGTGCRVQGSGCRVQGSGCRVQGSGFRVQGSGFRVQSLGLDTRSDRW